MATNKTNGANGHCAVAATDHSVSGLRKTLFAALDDLRAGRIDNNTARSIATLSKTIIDSAHLQLEFEKRKLASEIPATLGEMKLVPPLDGYSYVKPQ